MTPLFLAVENHAMLESIRLLIAEDPQGVLHRPANRLSLLHYAVQAADLAVIKCCVCAGPQLVDK